MGVNNYIFPNVLSLEETQNSLAMARKHHSLSGLTCSEMSWPHEAVEAFHNLSDTLVWGYKLVILLLTRIHYQSIN